MKEGGPQKKKELSGSYLVETLAKPSSGRERVSRVSK